jgi:hypothetical protein
MLVEASGTQTLLSVVDHRSAEVRRRWQPPHTKQHTGRIVLRSVCKVGPTRQVPKRARLCRAKGKPNHK